jgi:phosphoadenosine phosphosulfate reductase
MQEFVLEIQDKIRDYKKKGKRVFISSSFQSHSIPMLHIIAKVDNRIPIYFLNTGYHFPETIIYKNSITALLNLQVIDLRSPISMIHQKDSNGHLMYVSDPDYCCQLNKTLPMEPILALHDVWITGVRADQNSNRKKMQLEMQADEHTLRYHPMLFWTAKMIYEYRVAHELPEHPLESQGYVSIGCSPCTIKYEDQERGSRWKGMKKEECGLHTDFIKEMPDATKVMPSTSDKSSL